MFFHFMPIWRTTLLSPLLDLPPCSTIYLIFSCLFIQHLFSLFFFHLFVFLTIYFYWVHVNNQLFPISTIKPKMQLKAATLKTWKVKFRSWFVFIIRTRNGLSHIAAKRAVLEVDEQGPQFAHKSCLFSLLQPPSPRGLYSVQAGC